MWNGLILAYPGVILALICGIDSPVEVDRSQLVESGSKGLEVKDERGAHKACFANSREMAIAPQDILECVAFALLDHGRHGPAPDPYLVMTTAGSRA